eukprot:c11337_g1_i3.p1 GENE.c11337_g1_i3~~c11337_g1_i3.p1  ORF type:complete len:396 (+),score=56.47 c11337_g1_i3:341-1528(+)
MLMCSFGTHPILHFPLLSNIRSPVPFRTLLPDPIVTVTAPSDDPPPSNNRLRPPGLATRFHFSSPNSSPRRKRSHDGAENLLTSPPMMHHANVTPGSHVTPFSSPMPNCAQRRQPEEVMTPRYVGLIIDAAKCRGVHLFALDLDHTILNTHTKPEQWTLDTVQGYSRSVRPFVKVLVSQCLTREISVAVVTFCEDGAFVRALLEILFPEHHSQIIVRCNDGSWDRRPDLNDGDAKMSALKMPYIISSLEEIAKRSLSEAELRQKLPGVCLVDDDKCNVDSAGQFCFAIQIQINLPNPDTELFQQLISRFVVKTGDSNITNYSAYSEIERDLIQFVSLTFFTHPCNTPQRDSSETRPPEKIKSRKTKSRRCSRMEETGNDVLTRPPTIGPLDPDNL